MSVFRHIRIEDAIKLRPKKWYDWINPFWWWRASKMKKFLRWWMKKTNFDSEVKKAHQDALLYGTGIIEVKEP